MESPPKGQPLVIVTHPDGELAIGTDPDTIQQKRAQTQRDNAQQQLEAEAAARAVLAERREQALVYKQTTLRQRRVLFLVLLAADLSFFLAALVYKWVARECNINSSQPTSLGSSPCASNATITLVGSNCSSNNSSSSIPAISNSSSGGSVHSTHFPLVWWLDPRTLRLEDIVFSIATDLLGIAGASRDRTPLLSLYCVVQVLSTTAVSTVSGLTLSLFTMFRLVLLLLAFYLRSAIFVHVALLEAAELAVAQPRAAARLRQLLQSHGVMGFFRVLRGSILRANTNIAATITVATTAATPNSSNSRQPVGQQTSTPAAGSDAMGSSHTVAAVPYAPGSSDSNSGSMADEVAGRVQPSTRTQPEGADRVQPARFSRGPGAHEAHQSSAADADGSTLPRFVTRH